MWNIEICSLTIDKHAMQKIFGSIDFCFKLIAKIDLCYRSIRDSSKRFVHYYIHKYIGALAHNHLLIYDNYTLFDGLMCLFSTGLFKKNNCVEYIIYLE